MRGLFLVFTLGFGEPRPADRWFSADKAKHFFVSAFVQSASFSALRAADVSRDASLAGATIVSSTLAIAKELADARRGGSPSFKDLAWDAAGMAAVSALLARTER